MELIKTYFPDFSDEQLELLVRYTDLLLDWNQKINLISRQDSENILLHHILHSLAIVKYARFAVGTRILDLGTGGGLPGIPLAIAYPGAEFHLIDARNKKITAVTAMVQELGLENVRASHSRVEELKAEYDFVVSRAVARLEVVWSWCQPKLHRRHRNAIPNGLLIFKGGKFESELKALPKKTYYEVTPVQDYFKEAYFEEKYLVYVQR